ncbi:uncharacterized protein LOC108890198 isoform X1 [Lates japonicus]
MERGRQKLQNILEDGLSRDLLNAGRFCFSCEQIFSDRKCLEEHVCSAASYICSCGTEFTHYKDMLEHSTTHEPGHQVLDHETIRKRRIEKRIAEEEQLKRLQTGEVVWKTPKSNKVPSISSPLKPMLQLLQRHKCIKAQEFMAQHVRGGRQHYKLKRVTPVAGPVHAQMNGERKLGVPAAVNMKKTQVMAVSLDKGQGAVPVNGKTAVDIDDDCYIVESGPDKPAEMIYQVTSSVPIIT